MCTMQGLEHKASPAQNFSPVCAHVAAHCARTLQGLPLHKTFLRAKHTRLQRQQAGGGRSAQSFLRDFWQHKCTIQFLCSISAQAIEASSWKSSCMRKQSSNSSSTVFENEGWKKKETPFKLFQLILLMLMLLIS